MLDIDTYRTPRKSPPSPFFPLEAEELMQSGQVENATELCKRGLVYFPDNISGYAVLAQAYVQLGRSDRALNVLEQGYRRTGAEGLQTLRKIVSGEIPPFSQETESNGRAAADEPSVEEITGKVEEKEEAKEEEISAGETTTAEEEKIEEESPANETTAVEEEKIEEEEIEEAEETPLNQHEVVDVEEPIEEEAPASETTTVEEEEKIEEIEEAEQTPRDQHEVVNVEEPIEEEAPADEATTASVEEEEKIEEIEEPEETPRDRHEALEAEKPIEEEIAADETTAAEEEKIEESEKTEEIAREIDAGESVEAKTETADRMPVAAPKESVPPSPPLRISPVESGEEEPEAGGLQFRRRNSAPGKKTPQPKERKGETPTSDKPGTDGSPRRGFLSLHSGTKISRLSSSNLRLIPGLEFAPLRRDDDLKIRIAPLVNEPPPAFNLSFDPIIPGLPSAAEPSVESAAANEPVAPETTADDFAERLEARPDDGPDLFAEDVVENTVVEHTEEEKEEERAEILSPSEPTGLQAEKTIPDKEEEAEAAVAENAAETDDNTAVSEEEPADLFPEIPESYPEEDFKLFLSEPEPELATKPVSIPSRQEPGTQHSGMTPLEELARRLETARIPIVEEQEESYDSPAFEPSIVSDTFASILAGQGAYSEAIKAYQMLARLKPERRQEYEKKIAELRWKISSV